MMRSPRQRHVFVNEPPKARRAVFFWAAAVALGAVQLFGLLISADSSAARWSRPEAAARKEQGVASWYGSEFHGLATASGEPFDMYALTAAHPTLPLGTHVRIRNLENGRSVDVRINDRGPYRQGATIDLSYRAAEVLGMVREGRAPVEVVSLGP